MSEKQEASRLQWKSNKLCILSYSIVWKLLKLHVIAKFILLLYHLNFFLSTWEELSSLVEDAYFLIYKVLPV